MGKCPRLPHPGGQPIIAPAARIEKRMTIQIVILLVIIVLAMIAFSVEVFSADVIGLGILVTLILTGLISPEEAFAGFGSEAFILILGLLIMTAALMRTGVVELTGRWIVRKTGDQPRRLLGALMSGVAGLSAFISNTAATAFFVPIAMGITRRLKISPSQLLLPIAFASILSSSVTLISSSSNIVISGLMTRYDLAPIGLFELAVVGIPVAIVGLAYMYFIGSRLIPDRAGNDLLEDEGRELAYSTEIEVLPDSPLIGKAVEELADQDPVSVRVLKIRSEGGVLVQPPPGKTVEAGDVLLVEGQRDELLKVKDAVGIDFEGPPPLVSEDGNEAEIKMVEAILLPGSVLIGRTLKRLRFRERYGIQVLGIHRSGRTINNKLSRTQLRVGDQLLLAAEPERLKLLSRERNLRIIGGLDDAIQNRPRAPWAVAIFVGSLALGSLSIVSLPVAALIGGFFMLVTRTISPEEAYRDVEWKALILIGSMLAIGRAMEATGAAEFLAGQIVGTIGGLPGWVLLSAFFFLTLLLTQPMSNQAAAVVVIPIALGVASQLGLNPRTFAMMIAVAASTSYMTPLEPSCMIVYGPGQYRFGDFLKVGTPLTILIYLLAIALVPVFWPLTAGGS